MTAWEWIDRDQQQSRALFVSRSSALGLDEDPMERQNLQPLHCGSCLILCLYWKEFSWLPAQLNLTASFLRPDFESDSLQGCSSLCSRKSCLTNAPGTQRRAYRGQPKSGSSTLSAKISTLSDLWLCCAGLQKLLLLSNMQPQPGLYPMGLQHHQSTPRLLDITDILLNLDRRGLHRPPVHGECFTGGALDCS